jgi:hypothetical protein
VAEGLVPTDIAALLYKNGLTLDDVVEIGQRLLKMKNVELVGFHQHNGRHRPSTFVVGKRKKMYFVGT